MNLLPTQREAMYPPDVVEAWWMAMLLTQPLTGCWRMNHEVCKEAGCY
jgi:hypothetical protein